MHKQRTKQLLNANIDEDRNIRQLEKQLKLNKRKSKSVPKSFAEDGLDCKYFLIKYLVKFKRKYHMWGICNIFI